MTTMYLTVSRGNDAENTNHSWEEIKFYSVFDYEGNGGPRYQVAALLQVGDETALLQERLDTVRQYRMQLCRSGDKVPVKIPRKIIRSS